MQTPIILKSKQDWLKERLNDISATEAAILLGLYPYKNISSLIKNKRDSVVEQVKDYHGFMRRGRIFEAAVIEALHDDMKWDVRRPPRGEIHYYRYPKAKLGATPDAFIIQDKEVGGVIECKTATPKAFSKWVTNPPFYYLIQVHVQLMCTGLDKGYIVCMLAEDPFPIIIYEVIKSKKLSQLIIDRTNKFWDDIKRGKEFKVNEELKTLLKNLLVENIKRVEVNSE